jgi:hypothetical protein
MEVKVDTHTLHWSVACFVNSCSSMGPFIPVENQS